MVSLKKKLNNCALKNSYDKIKYQGSSWRNALTNRHDDFFRLVIK